jgi:hypothetical protein
METLLPIVEAFPGEMLNPLMVFLSGILIQMATWII